MSYSSVIHNNRCIFVLCTVLALTSCKLRIVVPEGGSVTTSSGAYHCAAGETCDIDVVDFYFDENFAAVPADGYAFKAWRKGDRRFCGNDPKPCHLLTTVFTGDWIPAIQEFLDSSVEVFYLEPIFAPKGDIIPVNGREWLQPDLFIGLTWNQINATCPDGVCNGVLAGRDVTGWTWASVDDVVALFNYYIGHRAFVRGVYGYFGVFMEVDSAWAPAIFNTGWRSTSRQYGFQQIEALTRTTAIYDQIAAIFDTPPGFAEEGLGDYVTTRWDNSISNPSTGAWLYRER